MPCAERSVNALRAPGGPSTGRSGAFIMQERREARLRAGSGMKGALSRAGRSVSRPRERDLNEAEGAAVSPMLAHIQKEPL